jgi:YD repeat-containing protein
VVSAIPRSRREPGRAVYRTRPPRPLLHPRRLGGWLAWDNDNRLTQVQFQAGTATPNATPLTTTYTWDADSRLTTKTLPNGITVTHTYDVASRLTRLVYRNSSNQLLEDISYSYDAAGQRTARSSTNPLGSRDVPHQASYDANNRLTHLTLNPGTAQAKTYTLSYNATGSLISKVNTADASDTSTTTWDSQQRLTQVQTPELTATGANTSQISKTVTYTYDAAGNVTSILYPSGRKLTLTYTDGQLTALSLGADATATPVNLISSLSFEPFGGPKGWSWQFGTSTQAYERSYDTSGRLIRYRLGNTIRDLGYDAADRICHCQM